ncbi:MAG: hypothetical protein ACJASL_002141 [Paraglaciecola sp.]|jgi:hypothetical protein
MHLLISKAKPNAKQLLEKFNSGLATLKSSGKLSTFEHQFKNGFYKK